MRAGMFIVVPSSRQPRDTRAGSVCPIVYLAAGAGARGNLVETALVRNRWLTKDDERDAHRGRGDSSPTSPGGMRVGGAGDVGDVGGIGDATFTSALVARPVVARRQVR